MIIRLAIVLGAMLVVPAEADIYEWRDAEGVLHYTNRKERIPTDARARVMVEADETAPQSEPPPPRVDPEPHRLVPVASNRDTWDAGYEAGMRDAMDAPAAPAVSIEVNAPLAVAHADPEVSVPHAGQAFFVYYPEPLVTTSFDRGRSRHLTLRMLLQEQFQLDRDGPFLHRRLPPIGLGPRFRPFLHRGLPHYVPHGGRVIGR